VVVVRILKSEEWVFRGIEDGKFIFDNIRYPDSRERLLTELVGWEYAGTRIYFEIDNGEYSIRIPKRKTTSPSLITEFVNSMHKLVETDTSYFVRIPAI